MKKQKKIEKPVLLDGWFWVRLHIPLRGGHYHHEWLPARIQNGMVRLFGSSNFKPADAPVLENALWSGPIEPPPLEDPTRTALALERAGNGQKRKNRRVDTAGYPRIAAKAQVVADGIVAGFIATVDSLGAYYREHPHHRAELVQKIAGVIERAFSGRSATEEA